MRLTLFTDYSLRTLMYLGLHQHELASIGEVAAAYDISEHHLTKVAHRLGQLGLIETIRGRGGGLRLARRPKDIRIGHVVRQIEEDLCLVECFGSRDCIIAGPCQLTGIVREALDAFLGVLDRYTLADLLQPTSAALARRLRLPRMAG